MRRVPEGSIDMKKRLQAAVLTAIMLLTVLPMNAFAGFVQTEDGMTFQTEEGRLTGLQLIGEDRYLFNEEGVMLTGPQKVQDVLYYFDQVSGKMLYGWIKLPSVTYYADLKTGALLTNTRRGVYTFLTDGSLQTGELVSKGTTGWVRANGSTFYYNASSQKVTGFQKINGKIYFFNSYGVLQTNTVFTVNGSCYFVNAKGVLSRSKWISWKSSKYYAGATGVLAKGLVQIGNELYYFSESCQLQTNTLYQNGDDVYYAQGDGKAAKNTWIEYQGSSYWFGSDGKMVKNQKLSDGSYVGFDGAKVEMKVQPGLQQVDGKTYYYDEAGNPLKAQWFTAPNGKKYYFGNDGAALTGEQQISGVTYTFGTDGALQAEATKAQSSDSTVVVDDTPAPAGNTGAEAGVGGEIAAYAQQFVGNPYVYGGTSLTNGADCSGFCFSVFAHFGIKLLRVADDQFHGPNQDNIAKGYKAGKAVSLEELQPGDLVFYGARNYASHVAIYIGNDEVCHAVNSRTGIKVTPINYTGTPIGYMRYI
jgi:glucan-binding YG repeat protein